jgi:hypothetical protein
VKRKVTDRRYGSVTYLVDRVFDFDFRYYEPYRGNEPQSGLYVFKTIDLDSRDYPHVIERVKAYQGKLQQQKESCSSRLSSITETLQRSPRLLSESS